MFYQSTPGRLLISAMPSLCEKQSITSSVWCWRAQKQEATFHVSVNEAAYQLLLLFDQLPISIISKLWLKFGGRWPLASWFTGPDIPSLLVEISLPLFCCWPNPRCHSFCLQFCLCPIVLLLIDLHLSLVCPWNISACSPWCSGSSKWFFLHCCNIPSFVFFPALMSSMYISHTESQRALTTSHLLPWGSSFHSST